MKLPIALLSAFVFFGFTNADKSHNTASIQTAAVTSIAAKKPGPTDCTSPTSVCEKVVCLATTFKALLTAAQITTLEPAFTTTIAARWSNLPCGVGCRNGLEFSTLTAAQIAAAKAVIAAASGTATDEGYAEFSQINLADTYLSANGGA